MELVEIIQCQTALPAWAGTQSWVLSDRGHGPDLSVWALLSQWTLAVVGVKKMKAASFFKFAEKSLILDATNSAGTDYPGKLQNSNESRFASVDISILISFPWKSSWKNAAEIERAQFCCRWSSSPDKKNPSHLRAYFWHSFDLSSLERLSWLSLPGPYLVQAFLLERAFEPEPRLSPHWEHDLCESQLGNCLELKKK